MQISGYAKSMDTEGPCIEDVIRFWNSQPCNIKHSSQQIGSRVYFDEVETRKYFVEPHIPAFAEFGSWKDKRVLELGCGIGTDAVNFARQGADYTGIELSRESLKISQERFEVFNLKGRFIEGNVESVDDILDHESFDLIYSFGVLHHTPDISQALRAIRRIMNNKTVFKLMVYAKNSYKSAMIEEGLDQPEAQYGCPIANTYSKEEISELLVQSGFKINSISQDHIFPYVIKDYKKYVYKREKWFENMPNEVFKALEKHFGWHLMINATI